MQNTYRIDDLGDLPGGPSFSEAYGLNNLGHVVGYGTTATTNEAFVWTSSTGMQSLGVPAGSTWSVASGINNSGLVVGFSEGGMLVKRRAMVWQTGVSTEIPFNGAIVYSEAFGVNQNGEVCGTYREAIGTSTILDTAFSWDSRTAFSPARGITPLPADTGSGNGNAINGDGFVAGNALLFTGKNASGWTHSPYIWDPAVNPTITVPVGNLPNPSFPSGEARGINDARQVVGIFDNRGFLWTPGPGQLVGTSIEVPLEPYDINNNGKIVGVANGEAVLFDISKSKLTHLTSLQNVNHAGWTSLFRASAINDHGQIVGAGINSMGQVHGYLLSPISKPPVTKPRKKRRR